MLRRKNSLSPTGLQELVIVLPDGQRQIINTRQLHDFNDLKSRVELHFGIPCELQKLFLTDSDNPISDWVPLNELENINEVFIKTEKSWLSFVAACLRKGNFKVLQLVDVIVDRRHYENRLFVGLAIAVASGNQSLAIHLIRKVDSASVFRKRTSSGRTLLHFAVAGASWNCIELILVQGCFDLVTAEDRRGETPVMLAAKTGQASLVKDMQDFSSKNQIEDNNNSGSAEQQTKKEVRRQGGSLKININKQLSIEEDCDKKSQSTPTSPSHEKLNTHRLLDRETLANSVGNLKQRVSLVSGNKAKVSSSDSLPQLIPAATHKENKTYKSFLDTDHLVTQEAPRARSLSPSPPRKHSLQIFDRRKRSPASISAPASPKLNRRLTPSPLAVSPSENRGGGVNQVVFLPPWRRSGLKLDNTKKEDCQRRVSLANFKPAVDASRRVSAVNINRYSLSLLSCYK